MIESAKPDQLESYETINHLLAARQCCERILDLNTGEFELKPAEHYAPLQLDNRRMRQVFGPRFLMLLVGAGQLSVCLAQMATMLDYRVVACDPRRELVADWPLGDVEIRQGMPDDIVRDLG